jgi:hypothetical protein
MHALCLRRPRPIERHEFNTSHFGDFKGHAVQSRQNLIDRLNAQTLKVEVENGGRWLMDRGIALPSGVPFAWLRPPIEGGDWNEVLRGQS